MLSNWINEHEDDEDVAAFQGVVSLGSGKYFDKDEMVAFYAPVARSPQDPGAVLPKQLLQGRLAAPYHSHAGFPAGARWSGPYSKGYPAAGLVSFDPDPYSDQRGSQGWSCLVDAGMSSADPRVQRSSSALQEAPPCGGVTRDVGLAQLQAKVRFLEAQLRADLPYLQVYRFGGASLLMAIVSLAVWAVTGVGVPFHPVFAAMVVPVAIGVMVMAFFLRRENHDPAH